MITRGEAVRFSDSGWYVGRTNEEITAMQLYEPMLIVPDFFIFHKAIENALGRPVQTLAFGILPETLKKEFEMKVPNAKELIDKMSAEKEAFIKRADHDKIYEHEQKIYELVGKKEEAELYTSPDFQCDQTDGFPVSLRVSWEKEIAWLEINRYINAEGVNIDHIEELCADFGIKKCADEEQFNQILKGLGEDAYNTAALPNEDAGQNMTL